MIDFGTVRPGTLLYVPFHTFDSNDPSASVTLTGLAVTDIEIYKNGSVTQRASDSGYALLDTDGIDFDGVTGIHGFSVSLADNTTAGFWAAGSQYWVVVSSVTVDGATINFIAATFRIGYPDALINTTIATLASQTSFTLTDGPAEDDALNGHWAIIHDVASAVQMARVLILDYTGSTKTVTLAAGATFTAAAADNIAIMGMAPIQPTVLGRTLDVSSGGEAGIDWANIGSPTTTVDLSATSTMALEPTTDGRKLDVTTGGEAGIDWSNIGSPTATVALTGTTVDLVANAVDSTSVASAAFTAAKFAAGAIDANALATDAVNEIVAAAKAMVVESNGSITLGQAVSIILAFAAGVSSGQDTTSPVFEDPSGTNTRISGTTDGSGNRSAVTLTPSS